MESHWQKSADYFSTVLVKTWLCSTPEQTQIFTNKIITHCLCLSCVLCCPTFNLHVSQTQCDRALCCSSGSVARGSAGRGNAEEH